MRIRELVVALGMIIFLAGPVGAVEPLRIGLTLGLSGPYARPSLMQQQGFLLWRERVNEGGGLLGRPVEMIIHDDRGEKGRAKELYEKLIFEEKVDLLFGPYSSGITEAILPITESRKIPLLISGASADRIWQQGYRYVFGLFIPASRYVVEFLEMIALQGIDGVAILHAGDSFSVNAAQGTREWAEKFGLKILLHRDFAKRSPDLVGLVKEARQAGASVLVVCGHFDESVAMRLALKEIGWYPRAFFATVGPALDEYRQRLGEDADLVFSSSQWEAAAMFGSRDRGLFVEPFRRTFGVEPSYHAAVAFAAGQILEIALNRTRSLDREKLRNVLANMDAVSIIGRYGVDRHGMQIKHFPLTLQWQQGRKEIVWPESLATSQPLLK